MSVLERFMRMQWPCWNSRRQNRIVQGGFDLAREIFYPELGERFEYGSQCALLKHPGASRIESWLRGCFPAVKASPPGKAWPAFINCAHTSVNMIDSSRINNGQARIALSLMESLMKSNVGLKFVVVSPYRATKTFLEGLIQQRMAALQPGPLRNGLSGIEVSTADSFQGKEEATAIFLTTVTQESGPGFVKDPRRFNVGITRHIDFVFVIGEIATMDRVKDAKEDVTPSDQGEQILASGKKMRDAYQWFRTKGRVVNVNFRAGDKARFP